MTTLSEKVRLVDELMQSTKTSWVASKPKTTDLLIYLHVYRGDDIVATIQTPLDRDTALHAAHVVSMGMSADVIVTTFESWHSTYEFCPVTGKPWEPGEMAMLGNTSPEAREKGWVVECLTTTGYDRFKNFAMVSRPYAITGTTVEFSDADVWSSSDDGGTGAGYMNDLMIEIMSQPTMLERMIADQGPGSDLVRSIRESLGDEASTFHADVATLTALSENKLIEAAILMAETGSVRHQMIEERFGTLEAD